MVDNLILRSKYCNYLPYFLIIFFIFSCKAKKENGSPCSQPYTINNLFKNYDSSKFVIRKIGQKTEIWDTLLNNKQEEGSFYVFGKHENLEFYGYLADSTGGYDFGVTFDSLGHEIKKTGADVIRWFIQKKGSDSLKLTFLLFKINRSYGHITIKGSDFSRDISFASVFGARSSNTIGAEITMSRHQKMTILISGIIRDDCPMKERKFIDSVRIPQYLTN